MYWNHRVMRRIPDPERYPDIVELYIVEVYYNEDHSIMGWTEKEAVWGNEEYDGVEGLRQTLHWMLDATEKPVLDEAELLRQAEENPRPPFDEDELVEFTADDLEALIAELAVEDPGIRERIEDLRSKFEDQIQKDLEQE